LNGEMKPTRHLRLVLWFLLHKIHPQVELTREHELLACEHCRMPIASLDQSKTDFPNLWERLYAKRQRRLDYLLLHRSIPEGWTPPNPLERRSRNVPIGAWMKRLPTKDRP